MHRFFPFEFRLGQTENIINAGNTEKNPKNNGEKGQSKNRRVAGVRRMKKGGVCVNIVFNTNTACHTVRIYCLATPNDLCQTMAPL